ncbi:MAG: hypothetical protein H0U46_09325 [Actinobacteria bacterium]|nr:hypothetical protein [Actinomycetota bacterium]
MLDSLAPVADSTERVGSARFELEYELRMPGLDAPLAFGASGAYDTPAKKAELTMDLSSFAELVGGFAGSSGDAALAGLGDPSNWKLDMVLDGNVAYMRMPFLRSELPSGKEWVSIDLAQAARMQGTDFGELESFANGSDPRQVLDYLRSVAGEVTLVGTENVRGVPTSHYFAVVDWQKALASAVSQANEPGLLGQLQSFDGTVQNIPVDVWVDEERLIRRMKMQLSMSVDGQEAGGSFEMELFDYGDSVRVEVPAAADASTRSRSGARYSAESGHGNRPARACRTLHPRARADSSLGGRGLSCLGRSRLDVSLARPR